MIIGTVRKSKSPADGWVITDGPGEDRFPTRAEATAKARDRLDDGYYDVIRIFPEKEGGLAAIHWKTGTPLDQLFGGELG